MSEPKTTSARLLANGAWNTAAALTTGLISFLLVPVLLSSLGRQAYGVWVLIGSIFAYGTILNLGLSSAINRYIPVALAQGREDDIRRVASTGSVFFVGVGLIMTLGTALIYYNLTTWFNIPAGLADSARTATLVVGILLSLTVCNQAYGAILTGYQRYDLTALTRIVMLALRAVVLLVALTRGIGLIGVAVIYGLTELGVNACLFVIARRLMPSRPLSIAGFDSKLLKDMVAYGLNTFLYYAGAIIAYKASELIIGAFMKSEDVARYSVAAAGVLILTTLIDSVSASLKPAVSDLDARDESGRIRALSLASQKYTAFLMVPSTAFLVIMGREFLNVWTGGIDNQMPVVLALLALAQGFRLAQHSNFLVLVGKGEHRFFGVCILAVGVLTIGLSLLAVSVLQLGIVGVAAASLIAWSTVCGLVLPIHVSRRLQIGKRERWLNVTRPVVGASLPAVSLLIIWKYLHAPTSWAEILAVVATTALVMLLTVWHFGIDEEERARFRRMTPKLPTRASLKTVGKVS